MSAVTVEPMPNFSQSVPASSALAAELWISFAGLLRSHVAMRSITEPNANWQIVSNEPSSLKLEGWSYKLNIIAPEGARAGNIDWPVEGDKASERFATFSFAEDGQIFFDSLPAGLGVLDMEAAVELLLDALRGRRSA